MATNPDFRDMFAALNDAGADYLLVGAHAVAFHAEPRATKDVDIWVAPSPENAVRVVRALAAFGAPLGDVTEADFAGPGVVYQIGVEPTRIDLLTAIDGVAFERAWAGRAATLYADQVVPVIGRRELLENKRASGRPQDLADVALLERHAP